MSFCKGLNKIAKALKTTKPAARAKKDVLNFLPKGEDIGRDSVLDGPVGQLIGPKEYTHNHS